MTMEKYGVENVRAGQIAALERARARLLYLGGVLEKTGSEAQEATLLEAQIDELESALGEAAFGEASQ